MFRLVLIPVTSNTSASKTCKFLDKLRRELDLYELFKILYHSCNDNTYVLNTLVSVIASIVSFLM